MSKVFFAINMTADGFFGHEDGVADDELHSYYADLMGSAGVIVLGRITYQLMVPYWPDVAASLSGTDAVNAFALAFDSLEKVVFSRTLEPARDGKTRILGSGPEDEVRALKHRGGKDIAVGGLSVASRLSARSLIDEYHIVVHPVFAGKGPRLFETVVPERGAALELFDSKIFRSGAAALHYRRIA